ncbi:unnamed protein product [Linum trigynum]|uniref:Uncharacterized protein n=1 Tax=Linum trigynum TaxID=586398 RepID=A0AAV2G8X0_9ROSI
MPKMGQKPAQGKTAQQWMRPIGEKHLGSTGRWVRPDWWARWCGPLLGAKNQAGNHPLHRLRARQSVEVSSEGLGSWRLAWEMKSHETERPER